MSAFPHVSEALRRSLADIEPRSFNEHLRELLTDRPLTPAATTVVTGRAIDATADLDRLADLGVGVQLGYEGLRLTRDLIGGRSWLDQHHAADEDIDVLAAEVLVARGFNLLAGTGTVSNAVEIVRRFGQRSALESDTDTKATYPSLESDTIELAVETGADFVLSTVPPPIRSVGVDLAERLNRDPMPAPETVLEDFEDEVAKVYHLHEPPVIEERPSSSTVDP